MQVSGYALASGVIVDLRVDLTIGPSEVVAVIHFICRPGLRGEKRVTFPVMGEVQNRELEGLAEVAIQQSASNIAGACGCSVGDVMDAGGRFLEETFHTDDDEG